MNSKSKLMFSGALLGLLSVALPATTHASMIYTYTGNDFNAYISGDYSTADSVSGSFTVASALGDDLTDVSVPFTSFSFTDGIQTITSDSASSYSFAASTDAEGNITQWDITMSAANGYSLIQTYTTAISGYPPADIGLLDSDSDVQLGEGIVYYNSGTWQSALAPAPEPGTFGQFSLGILGCGLLMLGVHRYGGKHQATEV